MSEDLAALDNFSGTARLFPLPNLVLFPGVVQPLHIFEPRYRRMTADALAGDRLLALALLRPGWEESYEGQPPVHPVACLGKVIADQRLADGRYNLLLRGLRRIRILEELATDRPYRNARVELLLDAPAAAAAAADFRRRLAELVPPWFPGQVQALEQFRRLLESDLPMGALCDIFSFALPLDVTFKQELLEELDVGLRAEALLKHLHAYAPRGRKFPPEFSLN